jgi:hypothetical protein
MVYNDDLVWERKHWFTIPNYVSYREIKGYCDLFVIGIVSVHGVNESCEDPG